MTASGHASISVTWSELRSVGLGREIVMSRHLCYIGFHRYASRSNAEGERYFECSRCKKYKEVPPFGTLGGGS